MRILPQLLSIMDSKQGGKHKIVPRLDRRNARKNINYDASPSPGGSDDSPSLRTRSLDFSPYSNRTSFRIGGVDVGEIEQICSSLGLSGPDEFAISFDDWEANKAKSSRDLFARPSLYEKEEQGKVPGGKGGGPEEEAGDVLERTLNVGMRQKEEVSAGRDGEVEESASEVGSSSRLVDVGMKQKVEVTAGQGEGVQEMLEEGYLDSSVSFLAERLRGLNNVGVGGNGGGGGGIKGMRPPVLATPPSMSVRTFKGAHARARGEVTTTSLISSSVRGNHYFDDPKLSSDEGIFSKRDVEGEGSHKGEVKGAGGTVLSSALSAPVQVLDRNIDDLTERDSKEDETLEGSRSLTSRWSFSKRGSTRKYSKGEGLLNEEKGLFSAESARRGGEEISMRSTEEGGYSLVSGGTSSVGVGRKGVQLLRHSPPLSRLSPPPAMSVRVYDNTLSSWDLVNSLAPDDANERVKEEEYRGATVESDIEEVDGVVKLVVADALSETYSFSTSNEDDDTSSTNTDQNISPIDRFKISIRNWTKGTLLGSGSFGTVYEGLSEEGVFFAVKEVSLLDQGSQGRQCIVQLEQEIALLSQFEHENIVRYLGTDKDESKLYIFLELVTKGSLAQLYQRYHLQDSQVSAYTRQILHGLKYLHDRNLLHRDIKCANILVDANGSVKLADFGLAKTNKLNDVKSSKGTPLWMAPEVVNNKRGYGLGADIWSLGCTVLEMLTRQLPYSHLENSMQALFRIGRGEPPPVPDSLSSDAKDFIHKCLQVKPDNRPTAAQLLEHSFVKKPIHASGPASPSPSNKRR